MTRKVVFCTLAGLLMLLSRPLAAQITTPSPLIGSWQLTLTPTTPPVTPPVIPIPGLATFTTDGSMIETDGTEVVPTRTTTASPVFGTPGHGIWQPGPAIGNLYIQFISLLVNPNGSLHAKRLATITGTVDSTGNNFSGTYTSDIADSSGHTTVTSGTVTGLKIPHPALP